MKLLNSSLIRPLASKDCHVGKRSLSQFDIFRVRMPQGKEQHQLDLDHAVQNVRYHDPNGYLPGRLLPTPVMTQSYFAVRSFWVETGLRFGTTAHVPPHSSPAEHLDWWQLGIHDVFDSSSPELSANVTHPTLRLLQTLQRENDLPWTMQRFNTLLQGRRDDLAVLQYETLDDLQKHAERSCANLLALVLESGHMTTDTNPQAHEAARLVGMTHGLTNALRTSIPVMSITGKVIVPADLCRKYGVKSPRYLLSALGQGDTECVAALQKAVQDIAAKAREHLNKARALRSLLLAEPNGEHAVAVLLPGLASETFLLRLESRNYQLTDRDLRNVGVVERAQCSWKLIGAYCHKTY